MAKRICVIRQEIYPHELSVRREVETLHQAGYEMHVISLDIEEADKKAHREEIIDGVHVHRLPLRRVKSSKLRYIYDYLSFTILAGLKVALLHLKTPFVAIQINTMPDFLVFAGLVPKLMGAKVVAMMQEPVPELWFTLFHSPAPRIMQTIEQWALKYADASFTVTQQLKETYVARGADARKITVILNVPETRFLQQEAIPIQKQEKGNSFVFISHGAIEERYGQDTMLEAMVLVRNEIPVIKLVILGKGSYVDEFKAKILKFGLEDCVDYRGFVSLPELVQALKSAEVGIVAQKSSPYSNLVHTNKMYEFIYLGIPVLASRLKSVEAYFDAEALCFFEAGNPRNLADQMVYLYKNPDKRHSLCQHAYQLYQEYCWDEQKRAYLAVYQDLVGS